MKEFLPKEYIKNKGEKRIFQVRTPACVYSLVGACVGACVCDGGVVVKPVIFGLLALCGGDIFFLTD